MAQTPPEQDPDRHDEGDLGIVDSLAQLSFVVQVRLARHAAAHDVSMVQTRLLGILRDRQPTMQELARLLDSDKSSVTGLVDRAEKRGLVARTPSLDDLRVIRVSLTPSGRRVVNDVAEAFQTDVGSATMCLSASEKKHLSMLATRLVRQFGAATATSVPDG
jgi:MarR family transcriptional regulator, lower aerobic nicotinate degradation pathway regulator